MGVWWDTDEHEPHGFGIIQINYHTHSAKNKTGKNASKHMTANDAYFDYTWHRSKHNYVEEMLFVLFFEWLHAFILIQSYTAPSFLLVSGQEWAWIFLNLYTHRHRVILYMKRYTHIQEWKHIHKAVYMHITVRISWINTSRLWSFSNCPILLHPTSLHVRMW